MMGFKDKIKELRQEKGLSQQAVADSIYVSRSAVAKWENGLGLPSKESLRLLSEFYNVDENNLLEEQIYEKELVSKNIKIKRMKLSIFLSCGVIGVLILTMVILGFTNNGVGNNPLLYNSIPVVTINNEEIKYSEISSEYKIDSNGDFRQYDYAMVFPRIAEYENMNLIVASDTYQISLEITSNVIGEYYYLNDDYSLSEETSGWTLIQLHDLDIDDSGTFSIENTSFSYVVIVIYAEFPDLKVNYYFLIDLR
ncbi:MAG: helix-turn-helix transcriptional regulator [Acholeplasmataceae bacterium]|nr:helix-turn-helix transcriptional regulator [Acholeplasmataceae bacterium]